MLSRRMAIISATVLLSLLAAAVFWNSRATPPYSSPTALRTNEAYLRAHAPGTNFPSFDTNLFKSVSIEKTETGLTIKYQTGEEPPWRAFEGSLASHMADSTGTIRIGDGSIQLAFIGAATERPAEVPNPVFVRIPPKYFTPDLKPADQNDPILKLEWYRQDLSVHKFPATRFIFTCSNLAEVVTLRFDAFDARTHYPLGNRNYRQGPFRDTLTFDSELKVWHQTPIELLITLAMGPTRIYSTPLAEGTELKFPGGALKLLAIAEGGLEVVHMGPGAPTNTVTLTQSADTPRDRPLTSLVFYSWPREGLLSWDLEFTDDVGNAMSAGFNASSGPIIVRTVDCSRERLKEIRVKQYPNVHTLSFTIPELPGLPEQNRNLQNLFELHVPYLEIQHRAFLNIHLGDLVQMQAKNVPLSPRAFRSSSFQVLTNTTPRALFDEVASSMPEHHTLVVDPKKNEIRARRHPLAGPMNFIKGILRIK
jgi:hypothetical protein